MRKEVVLKNKLIVGCVKLHDFHRNPFRDSQENMCTYIINHIAAVGTYSRPLNMVLDKT